MTVEELKNRLENSSIVDKFIYINVIIFVVALITNTFVHLSNGNSNLIVDLFALNKNTSEFLYKPYTFITYGFLHIGFIHILFNLITLYYLGNLFLNFFSSKKFIIYYILGTIFGGILFVLSYQYFPVFKNSQGILLGASAGIAALLVGLATYTPNYEINLRLIGYVKLWILALIFIVLTIVLIPNGNAGGQIAHLGGALLGFLLTKYYANQKSNPYKKSKSNLKTVYKAKEKSNDFGLSIHQKKILKQRRIDTILDKISKSGYDSLNKEERDFLANASKN
jgi:membrane associated rhomboid family serine protease